jgi:hypothetical protein
LSFLIAYVTKYVHASIPEIEQGIMSQAEIFWDSWHARRFLDEVKPVSDERLFHIFVNF